MDSAKYSLELQTRSLGKPLYEVHSRSIRSKVLDMVFGKKNRLLIIAPSGCIESISLTPAGGDGDAEGKGEADGSRL